MIELTTGNLLQADAEALVNTVNCVGYMGKGIALQFKRAFPANFAQYEDACAKGDVKPGRMLVHETGELAGPKCIVNFPTKRHWRGKSRLEDIDAGLVALVQVIRDRKIRSIAVPPLGCGNGGLRWGDVQPRIQRALGELPNVRVLLFEPKGAPPADTMPVGTPRPKMTVGRALLIRSMAEYSVLGYEQTLLEVHKLAYFLQEAGAPLQLQYDQGLYGPYAPMLQKVLEHLEGHFIRGLGDSSRPDVKLRLLPGAIDEADSFLRDHPQALGPLERTAQLIEGFETPYGMELLSSVHWVAVRAQEQARTPEAAIAAVHNWNERKRRIFKTSHIRTAWERLVERDWLHQSVG